MPGRLNASISRGRVLLPRYPSGFLFACTVLVATFLMFAPGRQQYPFVDPPADMRLIAGALKGQRPPLSEQERFFQWIRAYVPPDAVVIWLPWPPVQVDSDPIASEVSNPSIANYYLHPRALLSTPRVTLPSAPVPVDTSGACHTWDQRPDASWFMQQESYAPRCAGMSVERVLKHGSWQLIQLRTPTWVRY